MSIPFSDHCRLASKYAQVSSLAQELHREIKAHYPHGAKALETNLWCYLSDTGPALSRWAQNEYPDEYDRANRDGTYDPWQPDQELIAMQRENALLRDEVESLKTKLANTIAAATAEDELF